MCPSGPQPYYLITGILNGSYRVDECLPSERDRLLTYIRDTLGKKTPPH